MDEKTLRHRGMDVYIDISLFSDFSERIDKIGGFAVKRHDCYVIAINTSRPLIVQRFVLGHELAHVFLDHLEAPRQISVKDMEREANKAAWDYYRAYRDDNTMLYI